MTDPTVNSTASLHARPETDPDTGSAYAEDVEDQLVREAHERFVRDPSFFDPFGGLLAYLHQLRAAVDRADEHQRQQGERLAATQEHRDPPDLGGTDYLGHEHAQLKQWVTTNFQPDQVHDVGRVWNAIGETLRDLEADLRSAAGREHTEHWQGRAAERAHAYTTELAAFAGRTGDGFTLMGNRISLQGDAAEAARSMPDPVEFDLRTELLSALASPNPAAGMARLEARFARKQQAHAEAARHLDTMEGRFAESAATMPAFAQVPRFADGAAGTDGADARPAGAVDRPPAGIGGSGGPGGSGGLGGSGVGVGGSGSAPMGPAGVTSPVPVAPNRPGPSAGTAPTSPAGPPPVTPAARSNGRPAGPADSDSGRPRTGFGSTGREAGGAAWRGAGGPTTGSDRRGHGGGSQAGHGWGGGPRPGGPRPGGPVRGGPAPGGASPGGPATGGASQGGGASQVGGAPGVGSAARGHGMTAPGTAAGRREDDEVRRRPSWLVETDEDVWGDGGLVAPPVIGEPSPER